MGMISPDWPPRTGVGHGGVQDFAVLQAMSASTGGAAVVRPQE